MRTCIGLMMISTAFVIGGVSVVCFGIKEKILTGIFLEIFVALLIFGSYMLTE